MKKAIISKDISKDKILDIKRLLKQVHPSIEFWEYEGSFITMPATDPFIKKYATRYDEVSLFFGSEKECNLASIKMIKGRLKNINKVNIITNENFKPPEDIPIEGIHISDELEDFIDKKLLNKQRNNAEYIEQPVHHNHKSDELLSERETYDSAIKNIETATPEKPEEIKEKENVKVIERKSSHNNNAKRKYEEKVIEFREYINIPVWKKNRIKNKSIGVWSPLQRIGVSTFINNFCFFLSEYPVDVAVLEGLSNKVSMKSLLSRYSGIPSSWGSYCSFIKDEIKAEQVRLNLNSVDFYPLGEKDLQGKWDSTLLKYYMEGLKFYDTLFIDLPTGEMSTFTKESLNYLDEVWILINNDVMDLVEWKTYINETLENINVKLIFNDYVEFSEPKAISDALGYTLISKIPSLHMESIQNQYLKTPLYYQEGVADKVKAAFESILGYLADTQTLNKKETTTKDNFYSSRFPRLWKKQTLL